jgi:hypothetical protein
VVAEAQVALCVGEFCCDLGLQNIILEGNSLQVVNVVKEKSPNWCRYGQLVANIQMVLSIRRSWQISHIHRVTNYTAHGLAKAAVKQIMDMIWIDEIPKGIRDVVIFEQFACAEIECWALFLEIML